MRSSFVSHARLILTAALIAAAAYGQTPSPAPAPEPEMLNSVLWAQTSVEHDAAYLQAYRLARIMLDRARADRSWSAALEQTSGFQRLPPAVILDLDETALDNSPEEAEQVIAGNRTNLWEDWVRQERATALPGALEFLRYAQSRGVTLFYVSNRAAAEKEATRRVLVKLGFPLDPKVDTLYFRGEKPEWGSDKGPRRAAIAAKYRILLLIGDDFGDFLSGVRVSVEARRKLAAEHASYWGERWIVLPNPMYGSWDSTMYGFDTKMSYADQLKRKREYLRPMSSPEKK